MIQSPDEFYGNCPICGSPLHRGAVINPNSSRQVQVYSCWRCGYKTTTPKNKELLLEIQYKCNLNCIHCSSIGCDQKLKVSDIPSIVNLSEIQSVRISGGEPLMNEDLIDYINLFRNHNIHIILQTNGLKLIDHILKSIDEVWISYYGCSPNIDHNTITGSPLALDVVTGFILKYKSLIPITLQTPIFSYPQAESVVLRSVIQFGKLPVRLFALLNHGRCAESGYPVLSISKQIEIAAYLKSRYSKSVQLTCSVDPLQCNYDSKLVLKPDGSLFNCAAKKHGIKLCKR